MATQGVYRGGETGIYNWLATSDRQHWDVMAAVLGRVERRYGRFSGVGMVAKDLEEWDT